MMESALILSIIDSALKLALAVVLSIPDTEKAAFWSRHEARMAFWQALLPQK